MAYATEAMDWFGRLWEKQFRIEKTLGLYGARPKGMHRTTFEAKRRAVLNIEMLREEAVYEGLQRQFGEYAKELLP